MDCSWEKPSTESIKKRFKLRTCITVSRRMVARRCNSRVGHASKIPTNSARPGNSLVFIKYDQSVLDMVREDGPKICRVNCGKLCRCLCFWEAGERFANGDERPTAPGDDECVPKSESSMLTTARKSWCLCRGSNVWILRTFSSTTN